MKLNKRLISGLYIALITVAAALALIILSNASIIEAGQMFFNGIFGNISGFMEIFVTATPLILVSLGCGVAFKTGFLNIGAEGQFYMGAVIAAAVSLELSFIPGPMRIVIAMLAAFIAGGLFAFIAAFMKAKYGISEIIVTIMLNYIAINFVGLAVRGFLMDPSGSVPQSARIEEAASLAKIWLPTRLHIGFFIAIVATVIIWFVMEKTSIGYEMKVVGFNERAAKCNGINVMKNVILSALISGGLAGIAGAIEIVGVQRRLIEGFSNEVGYTAILVALLGKNKPFRIIAVAILFSTMQVGANSMQRQLGIPSAIVSILVGLVVLLVLGKQLLEVRKKRKKA